MSGGAGLHWLFLLLLIAAAAVWAEDDSSKATAVPAAPPNAKVDSVVDVVQGHKIADPYRWLEDAESPETQDYVRQEMAYTRGILDPLPGRAPLHRRLTQLLSIGTITAPQIAGKYYFYTRREGAQDQPVLLVREGLHGKDRSLVDANQMAADGTVALDWWFPSDDGKYVAYGTSPSGSEESTLHLIETANGKLLSDTIDRTRFASIAWKKDNSGFYYTRRPKKGEVPPGEEVYHVKVFYHMLGADPAKDPLIFGDGRNPQDIPQVTLPDDDDRWLLITVFEGWAKSEMYLQDLKAGTPPVELTSGKEFLSSGEILQGELFITTNENAPKFRVFKTNVSEPERRFWREIVPEADAVLKTTQIIHGNLVALYEKDVTSRIRIFNTDGKVLQEEMELPGLGSVTGIGGRWDSNLMLFEFQSFATPVSVYVTDFTLRGILKRAEAGKQVERGTFSAPELWSRVGAPGIDPSGYEVKQLWYASKDGTKVPMFVFYKKGLALNGKNPTLLTGYGGFNVSNTPEFRANRFVWLEHGGVFAVANLRGGAEFGEDWHRAGMLEKKQNVFDDFIAAAEFLISEKYTDKEHLAMQGGSNGGLLMGAALTQRPDLFRAVVCQVPLLDMLRYQNFQIAKLWIAEYGSAEDPKQFDFIYAYSPYHHVKAGTEYPAILFMTADTDTRVDPMHAKKMAALMQATAANGKNRERPILLRIDSKAGHGQGKPITKQIDELTDVYSFLFWQLGVKE